MIIYLNPIEEVGPCVFRNLFEMDKSATEKPSSKNPNIYLQ